VVEQLVELTNDDGAVCRDVLASMTWTWPSLSRCSTLSNTANNWLSCCTN